MTPIELILSKLPAAKRHGAGWMARCPAHEDGRASLSIGVGDDGRALMHCHAGCTPEAIVDVLGLKMAALMPANNGKSGPSPQEMIKAKAKKGGRKSKGRTAVYATAEDAIAKLEREHGPHSAVWTYLDVAGEPVGIIVRWDIAVDKDIRPVSKTADGWIIGGMPEPRPLYRLPELLARPDERVYICEGEKAADAGATIGLLTTTSPHGSKSATKADWTPLAGRDMVILPDNDAAGRRYASDVTTILAKLEPAANVKIADLPELSKKGDLYDWVEEHDSIEPDTLRAIVEALADDAPIVDHSVGGGPILTCMADVEPAEIKWLWPRRMPLGRITLLVGMPGEGKSFLTTYMAAQVSTESPWPDGGDCPSGSVILICAEDDPADTIRPRLDAHYADIRRVHLLAMVRKIGDKGQQKETMFTLADLPALEAALKMHPDCKLVVVDPIGSFLGSRTDAHRDNEVRAVLAPVAKLAEKYGVAVVVVAHRRKSPGTIADDLALGSRAFTGIARAVWHLTHDADKKSLKLLLPGKNNLAPEGGGLAFTIGGQPPAIRWEREPVAMSADDALAAENGNAKKKPGPEPAARNQAAEWLRDLLHSGPMAAGKIRNEAKEAGYAWRTVQRATTDLGIKPYRDQFGGAWMWKLPFEPTCQDSTCQVPGET